MSALMDSRMQSLSLHDKARLNSVEYFKPPVPKAYVGQVGVIIKIGSRRVHMQFRHYRNSSKTVEYSIAPDCVTKVVDQGVLTDLIDEFNIRLEGLKGVTPALDKFLDKYVETNIQIRKNALKLPINEDTNARGIRYTTSD
jgi:hypothetical protein